MLDAIEGLYKYVIMLAIKFLVLFWWTIFFMGLISMDDLASETFKKLHISETFKRRCLFSLLFYLVELIIDVIDVLYLDLA